MPDGLSGEEQAIYFSKVRKFFDSYACSRVMERGKKMSEHLTDTNVGNTEYIRKRDAVDAVAFGITIASAFNNETGERIDLFAKENDELWKAIKRIKALPSADVVQVVHARWENYSPVTIKCSRCGHVIQDWRYSECKYCPNCGAKMDRRE